MRESSEYFVGRWAAETSTNVSSNNLSIASSYINNINKKHTTLVKLDMKKDTKVTKLKLSGTYGMYIYYIY